MTTTTTKEKGSGQLLTPEFRLSFPALFTPRKIEGSTQEPKYSASLLFAVKETEITKKGGMTVVDIEPLKAAVRLCLTEKYGADRAKWPANLVLPFRDGKEKDYEGYGDGIVFINCSSKMQPGIVDIKKQHIIKPSEVYGGCFMRATINPYTWKFMGKEGVSFGLRNLQKIRDGEAFSGRSKPENDFDAIATPAGNGVAGGGVEDLGV